MEFPGGLEVKDPEVSRLWLGSLLWCGFKPSTGSFAWWGHSQKKKKKANDCVCGCVYMCVLKLADAFNDITKKNL